uniref:Heme-binding protein Shr-like Hb-interacting domain-containing protein n=1 Tax=Eubacterium cellulosolvens (strain ATCC 43171 / JCM 9499 / 6) TaxID=633697 RepID=I5ATY0_EUBC6
MRNKKVKNMHKAAMCLVAAITAMSTMSGTMCTVRADLRNYVHSSAAAMYAKTKNSEKNFSIINSDQTRLVNMKWAQYLVVGFKEGYGLGNTRILVDGVDVTDAMTKVTDDGAIVKCELNSLHPATLTVQDQWGQKKDRVELSDEMTAEKNEPSKLAALTNASPAYLVAHGPVSVFDYYITNYDSEGEIRKYPKKTTFDLNGVVDADHIRSYSPETERKADGSGCVEILFNYNTAQTVDWFDSVEKTGAVELVEVGDQLTTIGRNLTYTKEITMHSGHECGCIRIPLGQGNLQSNGRFYIRTISKGHKSALTPIHIVNEKAPKLLISESGKIVSGQNLHFQIKDMVDGLKESIETVELTDPTGETTVLDYIDDWYHYGSTGLFVLYNDTTREQGENHIPYKGTYTLTIKAAGYKTFSKKFMVDEGKTLDDGRKSGVKKYTPEVDTVSGATGLSTGGEGSSVSGGTKVSANLIFKGDLLINALILDDLDVKCAAASAIADRWNYDVICDYVLTADGKEKYAWTEYYNEASDAQLEGRYLSFAEYAEETAAEDGSLRPSEAKMVLEDNLLGDLTSDYLTEGSGTEDKEKESGDQENEQLSKSSEKGEEGKDAPKDDAKEAFVPKRMAVSQGNGYFTNTYFYLVYDNKNEQMKDYLQAVTQMSVNGMPYAKAADYEYISSASGSKFKYGDGTDGYDRFLLLTYGDGTNSDHLTFVIKAKGYRDVTFTIGSNGELKEEEPPKVKRKYKELDLEGAAKKIKKS